MLIQLKDAPIKEQSKRMKDALLQDKLRCNWRNSGFWFHQKKKK